MATPREFNSWDLVKLLGLALMLVDHIGLFFFPDELWLRAIGRSAAPIFLFLGGYASSYRLRWDLVILGILLTVSNTLVAGHFVLLNILLTIVICRLILGWRESKGGIVQPFAWYFVAMAWIISLAIIQYGSFGLLFALCGYMKRFAERYTLRQRQLFWLLTFVSHGLLQMVATKLNLPEALLMAAVLAGVYTLLWRLEIRPVRVAPVIDSIGKWAARHMAYIYAGHLWFFMWLTGLPF